MAASFPGLELTPAVLKYKPTLPMNNMKNNFKNGNVHA
jgi:hypothetical protein